MGYPRSPKARDRGHPQRCLKHSKIGATRQTDMHISTLRRSIEAMGGKLSLMAEFPDREPVVLVGIASLDA